MALSELTSNLSWYGANAGFRAAQSVEETRFTYDQGDLTVSSAPRGFDNAGFQSNAFIPRISGNAFNINGQGTATRLSQLGEGSKFPIGPEGQIHDFDTKRTGFNINTRYGDTFNNKTLKGLAATYTAASPIDDMYNKFKVRDEVYDPYGYAKTPFILKGIQKDGSSDPERWGMGTPGLDIPRGGITANAERTAADIERIGKFLIRPEGIAFIAKQNILRQMIPNIESTFNTGLPGGAIGRLNSQRIYNPLNTIATVAGQSYGLRFRNFGLLPIDDEISKYEDIVVRNRVLETMKVNRNRLNILNSERQSFVDTLSPFWIATSNLAGGPDSIGGIGPSLHTKSSVSKLLDVYEEFLEPQYNYDTPYLYTRGNFNAYSNETIQATIDSRDETAITRPYSIRPYYGTFDIFNFINGRQKKSLFQIGKKITNYTFPIKTGITLPSTGLQAQLDFHNGGIENFGDATEIGRIIKTYNKPYIGTRTAPDVDITSADVTDQTDESNRINGLYNKVTKDVAFTAIPQREVNKAANHDQRTTGPVIDTVKYKTLAYNQIRTITRDRNVGSTTIIDGTTGKAFDATNTPIALLATEKNVNNIVNSGKDENISDRWSRTYGDLIKFNIGGVAFFAYLTSLSMADSFGTDEKKELLAPYGQFLYSDHSRSVDVSFMVVADSADQLERQWGKLRQLQLQSGPVNISSGMIRPKTSSLTIGDIYKSLPVILESISFSVDNESPWEITDTYQRPMYISVDVSCRVLPSSKTSLPTLR